MCVRTRVAAVAAALAAGCVSLSAMGQSVTPGELQNAARQGEQFLRQQQELQEERQRERDRTLQLPSGEQLPESAVGPAAVAPEGKCVDITSLEVLGVHLLSKEQVADLQHDVVGHCIGAKELNTLLRRITNLYVSKGYVTTRAYVPAQNAKEGHLRIVVIEGKVERVEVEPRGSASAATAFPKMTGQVFNLRDAEQGIDQLNRLSTNNARIDIRPGSTPGSSVVAILNAPRRRFTGSFSSDDTGSAATGLWQGTASVAVDNPLRLNDGLLLSYTRNVDHPQQGHAKSHATMGSYSVPYGWWTGSLLYSESNYESLVQGITRNFVTAGTSRNETLRLDRVAYRDQSRKLTIYGDLTRRDTENFVAGQLIGASSRVLTLLNLTANLSVAQGATLWTLDAGLSRGVSWLGALHDPAGLPGNSAHGQFLKMTAGAGVSRSFAPFGLRTQVSSTFAGQWSNSALFPSEQIAISGPFAVRGYRDVSLLGDRGYTLRNELGFPFTLAPGNLDPISVRPFFGVDFGQTRSHNDVPGGYLSSGTLGLSVARAPASLQISWSNSALRSSGMPANHYFFARFAASF